MTPEVKLPEPVTGAMKVVAWLYTHKISGASAASDWRWPATHAARESHVETHLVRLSDAQALAGEVERLRAEVAALKGLEGTVKDSSIVADAERYRWLRDPERGEARGRAPYVGIENDDDYPNRWALFGGEADDALDASRAVATQEAKA